MRCFHHCCRHHHHHHHHHLHIRSQPLSLSPSGDANGHLHIYSQVPTAAPSSTRPTSNAIAQSQTSSSPLQAIHNHTAAVRIPRPVYPHRLLSSNILCQILAIVCEDAPQAQEANAGGGTGEAAAAKSSDAAAAASDGEEENDLSGFMYDGAHHSFCARVTHASSHPLARWRNVTPSACTRPPPIPKYASGK